MGAHSVQPDQQTSRLGARLLASIITVVVCVAITLGGGGIAGAAVESTVRLGTAAAFGALGGSTVTNTGPSVINGLDVGVSPGTAVTGFPPGIITAPGTTHAADAQASDAQAAALTAYGDAAGRSPAPADQGLADLTGKTLLPGVYQGDLSLSGTLVLDNRTDPDAVFIFQASSTLITESGSVVTFTTAHRSCNVFWQVGSSATLGTDSTFVGTVLAQTSITAQTGATVAGRLLAATGAVTLDSNVITAPSCAAPPTTTSATTTSATTTTTTTTTTTPTTTTASTTPTTSTGTPSTSTGTPTTTNRSTGATTTPPNENTTPSTLTLLTTTARSTARTNTTPPNENTTPSTLSLLTTTSSTTGTSTSDTVPLTQPSFPGGAPGGYGPPQPISPITKIGALLILLGGLSLAWRLPVIRQLAARVRRSRGRTGEHR